MTSAATRQENPRQLLWVGVVLIVAAIAIGGLGWSVRQRYAHVTATWTAVPAMVVEHFGSRKPTFTFTTTTGVAVTTTSTFNNGKRAIPLGQSVTAYYNPANPQEAALDGDGGKSIAWFLVCVILAGMGITGIVTAQRQLA